MHSDGPHYPLPLTGEGTTGLGKNLKPITHPLRADIPIMLGAEGPKNVALAAEICDGWLPIFYSPRIAAMYNEWLDEGFARPGARRTRETFEICATAQVVVTDDRPAIMELMKPHLALYMGGMGAEDTNFHADVYRRMGYAEVVDDVTKLFRSDRKDEAAEDHPRRAGRRLRDRRRPRLRAGADQGVGGRRGHDDGGRCAGPPNRSAISPRWCRHFLPSV